LCSNVHLFLVKGILAVCRSDSWPGSHARQNPLEIEQTGGVGAASAGFSDSLLGSPIEMHFMLGVKAPYRKSPM